MKELGKILEGILDADFDINDGVVLDDVLAKVIHSSCDFPDVKADGDWLVIDCSKTRNDIVLGDVEPLISAGYSKYRFINCINIEFYNTVYSGAHWHDFEIDAERAKVQFSGNYGSILLENLRINSKNIVIDAEDHEKMKIIMKGCKFDTSFIKFEAVTQLSVTDTCKFTNCKVLYLGRVGKSVARKAFDLLFCDIRDGNSFERQAIHFSPADETLYWDIDVMKTLSLKPNKWPDLGKIVIVPNGIPANSAPGICIYHPGKTMLPIARRINPFIPEYKNGWRASLIKPAKQELSCITKK